MICRHTIEVVWNLCVKGVLEGCRNDERHTREERAFKVSEDMGGHCGE